MNQISNSNPEFTILMPCLNERRTLPLCIREIQKFLSDADLSAEILVADNGSTDGSPAIARKRPEGGFELISGHRRTHAARRAGLDKIPVFVKDYSDDEAVCIMVDSNIQRTGTSFGMVS